MEDRPEEAEGSYKYDGVVYRLEEVESERWQVTASDGTLLGTVIAERGTQESGPEYTIDLAGEEGMVDEPSTDDWRRAVETLIDLATE